MSLSQPATSSGPRCAACGRANREGARHCTWCGSSLGVPSGCPHCGTPYDQNANFCERCGWNLREMPTQAANEARRELVDELADVLAARAEHMRQEAIAGAVAETSSITPASQQQTAHVVSAPTPQPVVVAAPATITPTRAGRFARPIRWDIYLVAVLAGVLLNVLDSQREHSIEFLDERKLDLFTFFYDTSPLPLNVTMLDPQSFFLLTYIIICAAIAWGAQRLVSR